MSMKNIKKYLWVASSLLVFSLPVIWFFVVDSMYGGRGGYAKVFGQASGQVTIVSLVSIAFLIIAVFNLERWLKLVPVACILLLSLLAAATYFNYWFSGYSW